MSTNLNSKKHLWSYPPFFMIPMVILLAGCMQTRSITEQYIKTEIEEHIPGAFSSIRTYSIYKSPVSSSTVSYVEFTGFKYKDTKGMVIGADKYFRYRSKMTGLPTEEALITYVVLSTADCEIMLEKQSELLSMLKKAPRPIMNEEIYQDFTVNDRIFMSFRRTGSSSGSMTILLWVDGEKYSIPATKFTQKLKAFINY